MEIEYQKIIDEYNENSNLRLLLMKLPIKYKIKKFYSYMKKKNIFIETENVQNLFNNIKGWIDMIDVQGSGWSVGVKEVHMHDNECSRNIAVEFLFRILNNEITKQDKSYIYNITLYILTHSHVFTDRIRHHLFETISNEYKHLFSQKQIDRIKNDMTTYGVISLNDSDEYDTEEEETFKLYDSSDDDCYGCNSD